MTVIIVAGVLAIAYILFLFWYYPIPRPLSKQEVENYVRLMAEMRNKAGKDSANTFDIVRKFGLEDDGKEFFMVNMVKYYEQPQYKDGTVDGSTAQEANYRYVRNTMPLLLKRACHPYGIFKPALNLSSINRQDDSYWDNVSAVRYRSRRDFFNMVTSPQWQAGYGHKVASLRDNPNMPSKGMVALPVVPITVFAILLVVQLVVTACLMR